MLFKDHPDIRPGIEALKDSFPDIDVGDFDWALRPKGFKGLVWIIINQQVSSKVAAVFWQRCQEKIDPFTPAHFLTIEDNVLRICGFSTNKARAARELAEAILSGAFNAEALEAMDDESVIKTISSLRGFGRWSGEVYLIFSLARPNVWPADDFGIQIGLQCYLGLEQRPNKKLTRAEGDRFSPHRTAASLYLWRLKS